MYGYREQLPKKSEVQQTRICNAGVLCYNITQTILTWQEPGRKDIVRTLRAGRAVGKCLGGLHGLDQLVLSRP